MSKTVLPKEVKKRDGSLAAFDKNRIFQAIYKAAHECTEDKNEAQTIFRQVGW